MKKSQLETQIESWFSKEAKTLYGLLQRSSGKVQATIKIQSANHEPITEYSFTNAKGKASQGILQEAEFKKATLGSIKSWLGQIESYPLQIIVYLDRQRISSKIVINNPAIDYQQPTQTRKQLLR